MNEQKPTEIKTIKTSEISVGNYQVWSRMSEEHFYQFLEDVKENGVEDVIHVDEGFTIIDGHHRYECCNDLGIEEITVKVHYGLSEEDKLGKAHRLNTQTREISRDEKIQRAIELRKEGRSYRQIGEWLSVSHYTARQWNEKFSTGMLLTVEKTEGKDGKQRPTETPKQDEIEQRRQRIKERRENGETIKDISKSENISVGTVHGDIKAINKVEEKQEKEKAKVKRKQSLDLLEVEAKLNEEQSPQPREDEPSLSPNNIVIKTRQQVRDTVVGVLGCFDTVGSVDEDVKESYLKQIRSNIETSLITLGQYTNNDDDAELITVCLELIKKINENNGEEY